MSLQHIDIIKNQSLESIPSNPSLKSEEEYNNMMDESYSGTDLDVMTNGYEDNLLSFKAKGCCGILEKIPIWVKLLFTQIPLIGLFVFAGIALATQVTVLNNVSASKQFVSMSYDVGNLVTAAQSEREISNTAIYTAAMPMIGNYTVPNPSFLLLNSTYQNTNNYLAVANNDLQPYLLNSNNTAQNGTVSLIDQKVATYFSVLNTLEGNRALVQTLKANGPQTFSYYTGLIGDLINILLLLCQDANTPTTRTYVNFIALYEAQQQVNAEGEAILSTATLTSTTARTMDEFRVVRDNVLGQFLAASTADIIEVYNAAVDPGIVSYMGRAEIYMSQNKDCIGTISIHIYTLSTWTNVTATHNQNLQVVQAYIAAKMNSENNIQYQSAVTWITVIGILIILFVILSLTFSSIMSFTIIAPWRRMNRIQRDAISKFVPQEFLRLIGNSNIAQVTLGQYQEKNLSILLLDIRDFSTSTIGMGSAQVFQYLNSYLNYVGPIIRKNGGFVNRYNADGFVALFKDSRQALKTSIEIQRSLKTYNTHVIPTQPPIAIGVSVHSGKMLVGTVGEDERMEGAFMSQQTKVSHTLEQMAKKFKIELLTTHTSLEQCGKSAKHVHYRNVGTLLLEGLAGNDVKIIEILNNDTAKYKYKNRFEKAVEQFENQEFVFAQKSFEDIVKEHPADLLAHFYLLKIRQIVEQCKYIGLELPITQILKDEGMLQHFANFCAAEYSGENIMFWIDIENFRKLATQDELRLEALRIHATYLSKESQYEINVNDNSKENITNTLALTQAISKTLFDKIQNDLEFVMTDTLARYRTEPKFIHHLVLSQLGKFKLGMTKLWLNDL